MISTLWRWEKLIRTQQAGVLVNDTGFYSLIHLLVVAVNPPATNKSSADNLKSNGCNIKLLVHALGLQCNHTRQTSIHMRELAEMIRIQQGLVVRENQVDTRARVRGNSRIRIHISYGINSIRWIVMTLARTFAPYNTHTLCDKYN